MATPHPAPGHAPDRSLPGHVHGPGHTGRRRHRPPARIRSGLLLAAAALTGTLIPGIAAADPTRATTSAQAAQLVAAASRQLEVLGERVNMAGVQLDQQRTAADAAQRAAVDAQNQLAALAGQIRQIARGAYAYAAGGGGDFATLDVLMTSGSAEEFVSQLGTLNAIAGHAVDVVGEVSDAADAAGKARDEASAARERAQRTLQDLTAQRADLGAQLVDYQRQYDALTALQQAQVTRSVSGDPLPAAAGPAPGSAGPAPGSAGPAPGSAGPAPGSAAPSSAPARIAVNTALAQVGDPYVWGAAGPDAFDCSGLTMYAYAAAGITLPHSSRIQATMGVPVSPAQLRPGDLVFFYRPISHEGMYIGNGQMVHASTPGQPVNVIDISSMMGEFTTARRVAG